MHFCRLPRCPGRSGWVLPPCRHTDTDQVLLPNHPPVAFRRALLLIAFWGPLCCVWWMTPRKPAEPDFALARKNYDLVREGMTLAEVEGLLGPPSGKKADDPYLIAIKDHLDRDFEPADISGERDPGFGYDLPFADQILGLTIQWRPVV